MILELVATWVTLTQAPDSIARIRMGDAVLALRDSLSALQGASATFTRDLASSSRHSVLARAGEVRARCVGASAALVHIDSVYARHTAVLAQDRGMSQYRRELRVLRDELLRCQREWQTPYSAETADSLRAWGPHRLSRIDTAVRGHAAAAAQLPYGKPKPPSQAGVGR